MLKHLSLGFATLLLLVFAFPAATAHAQWTLNGNNLYPTNFGNYVGIGGSGPSNKLVVGDNTTGASLVPGYTIAIGHGVGDSVFQLGSSLTAKGYMKWIKASNQLFLGTVNTGHPLVLQNAGGNVGIGPENPVNKLTVGDNSIGFGVGTTASIGNSSGDSSLLIGQDTAKNGILYWDSANSKFKINSGYSVVLQALGGKVGIGTGNNTPSATFEVKGTVALDGSSGTVTSQSLSTPNAWYTQYVSFPYTFGSAPSITLTQDNSGSGDISIISLRVKKNSVSTTGFNIDYFVNWIGVNGTTKFNWTAFQ